MRKLILLLLFGISIHALAQNPCAPPVVYVNGTSWKCSGYKDTLRVTGPAGTTYLWNNGRTNTSYVTGPIFADSTFYVVATNGGCSDTTFFKVTLRTPPTITYIPPAVACAGSSVMLRANASGTGPFIYKWMPGGQTTDTISVSPTTPTSYTVIVSNGCKSTKATMVYVYNPSMSACCDATISLGDSVMLAAQGNEANMIFHWLPYAKCITSTCDSVMVSPKATTTYTIVGTDTIGCQVERLVTVVVGPATTSDYAGTIVAPNPTGTEFSVYIEHPGIVIVRDVTGRVVFSEMENPGTLTFGKDFHSGVYFLYIEGKPEVKLVKLFHPIK